MSDGRWPTVSTMSNCETNHQSTWDYNFAISFCLRSWDGVEDQRDVGSDVVVPWSKVETMSRQWMKENAEREREKGFGEDPRSWCIWWCIMIYSSVVVMEKKNRWHDNFRSHTGTHSPREWVVEGTSFQLFKILCIRSLVLLNQTQFLLYDALIFQSEL